MTRARIAQIPLRLRLTAHHALTRYASSAAPKGNQPSSPRPSNINFAIQGGTQNVSFNDHVRNVAKTHRIGFPSDVRRFTLDLKPNRGNVQVYTSTRHCINLYDMKYIGDHLHPYTQTVLDRYISQKERPLWWSISSFGDATRIVITKAERWLRRGIRLALEAKGYDRYGKRITEQTVDGRAIQDLYGTLRVTCSAPKALCQLKFPEVQELSTKIIDAVERRYQRDTAGNHIIGNHGQRPNRKMAVLGKSARSLPKAQNANLKSSDPRYKDQQSSGHVKTPKVRSTSLRGLDESPQRTTPSITHTSVPTLLKKS